MSWDEFRFGNYSLEELTWAFLRYYEHPGNEQSLLPLRYERAQNWYEFFEGHPYVPPTPTPSKGSNWKPWMLLHRQELRNGIVWVRR